MINKINFSNLSSIKFQGNTNLLDKFKENLSQNPSSQVNLNGSEALANYNKPIVKKEIKDIQIAENINDLIINDIPEPIILKGDELETLSGEKILNSEGKLDAIVVKGENTSKEYHIDNENKKISSIIERDIKTGNPVRLDYFGSLYNKSTSATTQEFDPETGKLIKETFFGEGNLSSVRIFDEKNNLTIENSFGSDSKLRWVEVRDNKTGVTTNYSLDENKKIDFVHVRDLNYNTIKDARFKDGKIDEVTNYEYKPLKNIYGITPDSITLKPSKPVEKPDVNKLDGEKKMRSNNTIEAITVENGGIKTEYLMSIDGKSVTAIKEWDKDKQTKEVHFDEDGSSSVKEFIDGKKAQITYYNPLKQLDSVVDWLNTDDGEYKKIIDFSADGSYIREYREDNHPEFGNIVLQFDENKNLISIQNDNKVIAEKSKD